jgi:ubiquinone biosynthesis protein
MREEPAVGKLQRALEILRILYKHDFLTTMRRLATAERKVSGLGKRELRVPEDIPPKVRALLEDLGPTFIKIGQLLGTRPDLVPAPFVEEFRNLYDKTKPTPFPQVREQIESELGKPLEHVFRDFEEEPVASASIGQVHFATLQSGEEVAVKVQHPNIEQRVWTDFEIMRPIVQFIENLFAVSRVWQPSDHLHELAAMLDNELDYQYEAENQSRARKNFEGDDSVVIPKIYRDQSTKRVLTLERIDGIKFSNRDDPRLQEVDGERVAEIITHAMAEQIFEHRLFHADPSPGNLMVIDSETVAFLDWGAVGKVPARRADRVFDLIVGFMKNDLEAVTQALVDICNVHGDLDMPALYKDVEKIMDYHDRERASVGDPEVLDMIIQVAEDHDMLLPPDFILITRALFQFEGLCRRMDPTYELVEVLEPYIGRYLTRRALDLPGSREEMLGTAIGATQTVREIPRRVNSFLRKLESNQLRFTVSHVDNGAADGVQRGSFRQSLTWLVSAITVGTGLVVGMDGGPGALLNFVFFTLVLLIAWSFAMLVLAE